MINTSTFAPFIYFLSLYTLETFSFHHIPRFLVYPTFLHLLQPTRFFLGYRKLTYTKKMHSPCDLPHYFLNVSFKEQNFIILKKSNSSNYYFFSIMNFTFLVLRNLCLLPNLQVFSPRNFTLLGYIFRSMIHILSVFPCGVIQKLTFIFFHRDISMIKYYLKRLSPI